MGVNCFYCTKHYWEKNKHQDSIIVNNYLEKYNIQHVNLSYVIENKFSFPCCASFYLDTKLIRLHSLNYYTILRNALRNFTLYGYVKRQPNKFNNMKYRNYISGSYMEFTWSTMFGQKNIPYPYDCNDSQLKS